MSQSDLARTLGITFQQVQKYERGSNRVSVGKLYRLAEILDVPLTFFFDGLDLPDVGKPPETFSQTADGQSPILSRRELDLLRAWKTAPSTVSDAVASLLRAVAPNLGYMEEDEGAERETADADAPPSVPKLPRGRRANSAAASEDEESAAAKRRRRGAVWDPADIYRNRRAK